MIAEILLILIYLFCSTCAMFVAIKESQKEYFDRWLLIASILIVVFSPLWCAWMIITFIKEEYV